MDISKLKKIVSVVPTTRQKHIQRENFNAFIHYGINTFANKEWSNGTISPELFNPTTQDTDQWVKVLKYAGAKGIIFTAKHHDGFCMWQTDTTDYSIKNSPYKNGKGDVVRELAESCKKFGLKLGLYLSPWDRNSKYYGTPDYDDFYISQLTELLTKYGEIFAIWLDGACGAEGDGKQKQQYDFQRYYSCIRKLSPNTIISNCGPDVRWVGNENGFARKSEWNVVPRLETSEDLTMYNSQQNEKKPIKLLREKDILLKDVGSRDFLDGYDDFVWSPAEVDVSIRPGWFYHKNQNWKVKKVKKLMEIYTNSVGGNSLLLLNVPVDTTGRINDRDVDVLVKLGDRIRLMFARPINISKITAPEHESNNKIRNVINYSYNKNSYDATSFYTPKEEGDSYKIDITFDKKYHLDKMRIVENVAYSQRVEDFTIFTNVNGVLRKIYDGTTIGYNRIVIFKKAILTDNVTIVINKCRFKPYIEHIGVYGLPEVEKTSLLRRMFDK